MLMAAARKSAKGKTRGKPFLTQDQAKAAMQQVAGLVEIMGVSFDPAALKPIRTRP